MGDLANELTRKAVLVEEARREREAIAEASEEYYERVVRPYDCAWSGLRAPFQWEGDDRVYDRQRIEAALRALAEKAVAGGYDQSIDEARSSDAARGSHDGFPTLVLDAVAAVIENPGAAKDVADGIARLFQRECLWTAASQARLLAYSPPLAEVPSARAAVPTGQAEGRAEVTLPPAGPDGPADVFTWRHNGKLIEVEEGGRMEAKAWHLAEYLFKQRGKRVAISELTDVGGLFADDSDESVTRAKSKATCWLREQRVPYRLKTLKGHVWIEGYPPPEKSDIP